LSNCSTAVLALSPSFSNLPAPTAIYPLSLHDALPICSGFRYAAFRLVGSDDRPEIITRLQSSDFDTRLLVLTAAGPLQENDDSGDRKSTRLNSSHVKISYAVFCLKKKKKKT